MKTRIAFCMCAVLAVFSAVLLFQNFRLVREAEIARYSRCFSASEYRQVRGEGIAALEEALTDWLRKSDQAKQELVELSEALEIPEEVLRLETLASLRSAEIRQYWPYFEAQRELEHSLRVVDALRLKIETDKAELGGPIALLCRAIETKLSPTLLRCYLDFAWVTTRAIIKSHCRKV